MSETVTLTIDGSEITVPKGTTIIQAADKMGTAIPRFCWHPGLSVAGVCRFCMVKVEGVPKLQISCNTVCTDGMKVSTQDAEVKDAHKWALEYHLINHPLDCPICDQAGECELQNSYMKVGKYVSQMEEDKVLKPKALDVGDNLVLDTERCILCSRCVRFENEVTKTDSLGIFNRGDRAIIGTFPGKRINHNYSYNLVDVCPVGAFTARDFRFKCRVWFLKELKSICPGCSTGCNVNVFYNKTQKQYYRLKPRFNEDVNGHWMCDYGRTMYHHLNATERFASPLKNGKTISWEELLFELGQRLNTSKDGMDPAVKPRGDTAKARGDTAKARGDTAKARGDSSHSWDDKSKSVRIIFTPQYTNEEYEAVLSALNEVFGAKNLHVMVWRDNQENREEFDSILFRGDKNPNTQGLENALKQWNIEANEFHKEKFSEFVKQDTITLVFAPEVQNSFKSFANDIKLLTPLENVICFSVNHIDGCENFDLTIPTLAFTEKNGSFTNFKGITQKLTANPPVFAGQLGVDEIFHKVQAGSRAQAVG